MLSIGRKRGLMVQEAVRTIRKVFVLVFGITMLVIGAALLVLPGPGILTLVIALMILATEFAWARKYIEYVQRRFNVDDETWQKAMSWKSMFGFNRKRESNREGNDSQ
jgi:uncharacterized protein (TIGR02611 family)